MSKIIDLFVNSFLLFSSLFSLLILLFFLVDTWRAMTLLWAYRSVSVAQALWNAPLDRKLKIKARIAATNPSIQSPISHANCVFWQVALSTGLLAKSKGFPAFITSVEYPKELVITDDQARLTLNLRNAQIEFTSLPYFMDQQDMLFSFKHPRTLSYLNDITKPVRKGKK